jgi:hypothetical protein
MRALVTAATTTYLAFTTLPLISGLKIDRDQLLPWTAGSEKCTTILVSKGAGTEGPMTTHTADCANCDFRVNKVPPMDWKEGDQRAMYVYKGSYPSQVIENRGTTWSAANLEGPSLLLLLLLSLLIHLPPLLLRQC